jgi:hypothetical protein
MTLAASLVLLLAMVLSIAALFGAVAWQLTRARGVVALLALWASTAAVAGLLGGMRLVAVQRDLGFSEGRQQPLMGMALVFAVLLAIVLAPPAIALRIRSRRRPDSRVAMVALSSAGWALAGVLLAFITMFVLDFSNIPFVPRA